MPLKNIIKQIKQLALGLKEKPEVSLEDFQLEHIMLYHALAGTSPDNQKQFQEVRADIFQALERGSSDQLCIALKLPPLMWKEKLEAIFGQIKESESAALLECLLPDGDGLLPASGENPLRHSDWRVRANAAYVLAFLQKGKAVPSVVRALVESDSDESVQAAFCHLSYEIGRAHV